VGVIVAAIDVVVLIPRAVADTECTGFGFRFSEVGTVVGDTTGHFPEIVRNGRVIPHIGEEGEHTIMPLVKRGVRYLFVPCPPVVEYRRGGVSPLPGDRVFDFYRQMNVAAHITSLARIL
jgi:hypothetical protein